MAKSEWFSLLKPSPWQRRISLAFAIYSALLALSYGLYLGINRSLIAKSDITFGIFILTIIFSALGTILTYHRPENVISWILVIVALMSQTSYLHGVAVIALAKGIRPTFPLVFMWNLWSWIAGLACSILAFMFLLFPAGHLLSRRWRPFAWLLGLQITLTSGLVLFLSIDAGRAFSSARAGGYEIALKPLTGNGLGSNSLHVRAVPEIVPVYYVIGTIALTLIVAALSSQLSRYRRGDRIERYQIKWVLYVLAVWAFLVIPYLIQDTFRAIAPPLLGPLLPLSITIGILRYRLYDIDIIIKRTLVYGTLTALLALLYYAIVVLLQNLLAIVSDQNSPLVIVISTLVIAALFSPLRRRIQDTIDRRFYRRRYDPAAILAGFAQSARVETDLDALSAELLRVVDRTMQPESASLWLKE
jgi:hypothetical protein